MAEKSKTSQLIHNQIEKMKENVQNHREKQDGDFAQEGGVQNAFAKEQKEEDISAQEVGQSERQVGEDIFAQEVGQSKEQTENDIFGKEAEKENKQIRWLQINSKYMSICRYALFVIVASIVIYILVSHWGETKAFIAGLFNVLSPFFIGALAAYFLIPLVERIQGLIQKFISKGKAEAIVKSISIVLAYVLVLGFITIAFVFVIPQMGQSIQELTEKIPSMYRQLMRELMYIQKKYPDINLEIASEQLGKMLPSLMNYGTNLVGSIVPMVYSVSVSIVKLAINLILGIIIYIGRNKK